MMTNYSKWHYAIIVERESKNENATKNNIQAAANYAFSSILFNFIITLQIENPIARK